MSTNQIEFLQDKIREIGSAIFFNLSDSVLKLPTSIVNTIQVDEFGYVWFFVKKPKQDLREFETEFPVRMDYFKKGKECFLNIMGKGWVVTDPEEVNTLQLSAIDQIKSYDTKEMVLVKVKILKADYHETKTTHQNNWWQNAMNSVVTWFRSNQYRPDNTYFPAS
jgi:hypothetical protein